MIKHYMILSLLYLSAFSLHIKPIFPILNNVFKLDKICNNINYSMIAMLGISREKIAGVR